MFILADGLPVSSNIAMFDKWRLSELNIFELEKSQIAKSNRRIKC